MNRYFVRFIADTSFSLKHRIDHVKGEFDGIIFSYTNIEIFAYESLVNIEDKFVFRGIAFDSYVNAATLEDAQSIMQSSLYAILDMFTYSSLAPWTNLALEISYEANENLEVRASNYYFYDVPSTILTKTIRPINKTISREINEATNKSKYKEHLLAAFHQLNRGLRADTDVEEFLSYWTGIEYLAQPLNAKSGYTKEERFYNCPSCGKELDKCVNCNKDLAKQKLPPGKYKRVEEIALAKLNIMRKQFEEIRSTRGFIIHGGKWDKFGEAYKHKDITRKLLICSAAELLDLPEESINIILEKAPIIRNKITSQITFVSSAGVTGIRSLPPLNKPSEQPNITIKNITGPSIQINKDGSVNISKTPEYLFHAEQNVFFNSITYSLFVHKESGVKAATISEGRVTRGNK